MTDAAATRAQILAAFGVTEEDLDLLEQATGYEAARREAEREREEVWAAYRAHMTMLAEQMGVTFG